MSCHGHAGHAEAHATNPASAIDLRDLTLGYERHPAIHHVSCSIRRGDMVALVGPNGAGKSTLLKGIMGHLKPLGGSLVRQGVRTRDIAYLPQQVDIDRTFPIGVFDFVAMGLFTQAGAWRSIGRTSDAVISRALVAVGLAGFEDRQIGSLSGGQFQRVLFARLMLQDAPIILLDEPFRAVDSKTVDDLIGLIRGWHDEGRTIVAALHEYEQVRSHFPRTLMIAREIVAYGETSDVLTPHNLRRARLLIEAWDDDAAICERGEHAAQRDVA